MMMIRNMRNTVLPPRHLGIQPDANAGAKDAVEVALDEALVETFPASDPIAVDPGPDRE